MSSDSASSTEITLAPGAVGLPLWRRIHAGGLWLALDAAARDSLRAAQQTVQAILDHGDVVYGINTGFGKLAQTVIAPDRLAELQRNLVLSHAVGVGDAIKNIGLFTYIEALVKPTAVDTLARRNFFCRKTGERLAADHGR